MRKFTFLFLFLAISSFVFAQTRVINNFEEPQAGYWKYELSVTADTNVAHIRDTYQNTNAISGNAMVVDWSAHNIESWGGYSKIYHMAPGAEVYDWSAFDSVSFYFYAENPQSLVGRAHLRFELYDVSDVDDTTSGAGSTEFYYSFEYNVCDDSTSQWQKITLPLKADPNFWNGEGFNRTGWAGVVGNNQLDADQIKGYAFEFSIGGGGEGDYSQGVIIFDELHLTGLAEDPWLIFNGKTLDPSLAQFTWGQSALALVEGAGIDPKTNALLWTQGDEWANGWSGAGWNVDPAHDLAFRWPFDSLKFALKAETGTKTPIRFQLESGATGAVGMAFEIVADDQWHDYSLCLADFYVIDNKVDFDSSNITVVQLMGEGNATAGKKLWFDFIWTGNPEIDVVAPEAPSGVVPVVGQYQNLVTWLDTPNESKSFYTVLYSTSPITSVDDAGLETVAKNIAAGTQIATHVITAPVKDTELTYYYAVFATDAAGNVGALAASSAVVNTAKGVTAIHPTAPVNFAADGDLSEWANIAPFRMFPSDGSGTIVNNTVIDGDADLSLNGYVAFDENYLYFAIDAEDDIIAIDTTKSSYLIDSPDLYIGLYDWHGDSHTGYQTGDEPDLHFRFNSNQVILDNWGATVIARPGANYLWEEKFGSGYVVEGKISLDDLTVRGDARFHPAVGMRIPIDFSVNDADATGEREGILTYSINNQDKGWSDVSLWTYTWIGDKMVGVNENTLSVDTYQLSQNYPNPFNPSTVINYSLANSGMVSLKIFNILGQEVMSLVNANQNAGHYQVTFDASNLSTGLYIYRIQSGNFVDSKKMMLLK